MKKIRVEFIVVNEDVTTTKMMQAVDMFEGWKVIARMHEISWKAEIESDEQIGEKLARKLYPKYKEIFMIVDDKAPAVLIHLQAISDGELTWTNKRVLPYWNPKVKVVSNGRKWLVLAEFIRGLGFEPVCTKDMFVKEIKVKDGK